MNTEIRRDIEKAVLMSDVCGSDILDCRDEMIEVLKKYEEKAKVPGED